MDIEFTVERGEFFCLQCRAGKRTGRAALRIACEMVEEKLITPSRAIMLVDPTHVDQLLHPHFDPSDVVTPGDVVARGLAASPGAAVGEAVFQASRAEALAKAGRDVVLLRKETSAEDVGGLHAARGVATQRGGITSHAAVVARGWGKPCVVGCETMSVDEDAKRATFEFVGADGAASTLEIKEGDFVSIDGDEGAGDPPARASRRPALRVHREPRARAGLGGRAEGARRARQRLTRRRTPRRRAPTARKASGSCAPSTCSSARRRV
jgi:pyruvate,orthophosphate dikinase